MAYYSLEPFGEERADLRAGIISSTIANVNRGKHKPFKPTDFMPKFEQHKQTWKQQLQIVEVLNSIYGGKDLRNSK